MMVHSLPICNPCVQCSLPLEFDDLRPTPALEWTAVCGPIRPRPGPAWSQDYNTRAIVQGKICRQTFTIYHVKIVGKVMAHKLLSQKNLEFNTTDHQIQLLQKKGCNKVFFLYTKEKKNGKEKVRRSSLQHFRRSSLQHFLIPMPIIFFNLTSIRLARAIQKFWLTSIVVKYFPH